MKLTFGYFDINYTKKDDEYIDLVIQELKVKSREIMDFFNLTTLSKKVNVNFWDSLEKYRFFFNYRMKKYNKTIMNWEVARATNSINECRIDLLCLEERKRANGHENDNVDAIFKVLIHEFTHICHLEYNNHLGSMRWFAEALATNLSNQYDDLCIDCSIDDIKKGTAHYKNYYTLGKFILDNYDKNDILELAKNKHLLENETEKIFIQTLEYIETMQNKIK